MVQNIRGGESLLGPQCWTPYLLPAGGTPMDRHHWILCRQTATMCDYCGSKLMLIAFCQFEFSAVYVSVREFLKEQCLVLSTRLCSSYV